jgi:hypothetical protein
MIGKSLGDESEGGMHSREGSRWFQLAATTVGKERTDAHGMIEVLTTIGNLMEYCRADQQ